MAPNQSSSSIEIFISYAQEDEKYLEKLTQHLSTFEREKGIQIWHNGKIDAGKEPAKEIEKHLNSSNIILLLISSSFVASQHWEHEVEPALKRHTEEKACVIPVLLRSYDLQSSPKLSALQALPRNYKAITSWENEHDAFKEVAKEIREAIDKGKFDEISIPRTSKRLFKIPWRSLRNTLFTSVPITVLVIVMRVMGIFEASELLFFNQMMQKQKPEPQDSNLLLVEITSDDIKHYSSDKQKYGIAQNGASLPDKVIFQLLDSVIQKNPRVIGIDIYRNFFAYDDKLKNLFKDKEKSKLLIFVCKFPDTLKNNDKGYDPPPDVPITQVGLSDLLDDRDGVIRRQLLRMGTPSTDKTKISKCRNKEGLMESFSFKVAQKYLANDKSKQYSSDKKDGFLKSGNTVLQPLDSYIQGGYNLKKLDGDQILLNYRSVEEDNKVSPDYIARRTSVQEVLDCQNCDDLVKDKIILIGTPVESFDPAFPTPFSSNRVGGEKMRGLYLQAQMVSQLVSAVSDKPRPLLKAGFIGDEILLILVASIVGSILPQLYKQSKYLLFLLGGSYLFCILSFSFMCFLFFSISTKRWIPLFSPTCAFTLSIGVVIILVEVQSPKKIKPQ